MILHVTGDLFTSPAPVLVNAVNTAGVMGRGIARDFRTFYPAMYARYRQLCANGAFTVGQLWLYHTPHKAILNFPTKRHWRESSRLEIIEAGLRKFVAAYAGRGLTMISFPRLGAGLGGLDWETAVRPLMEHYLDPLPINVFIHERPADERDNEAVAQWLAGTPAAISFDRFHEDMLTLVANQPRITPLDGKPAAELWLDPGEGWIMIERHGAAPFILSRSTLVDLWTFVRAAGYTHPADLPGGLEPVADVLVALAARLPYLRPVTVWRAREPWRVGLQYYPPLASDPPVELRFR